MRCGGEQSNRPPLQSNLSSSCVKIYLCSNPADSVLERRVLRESLIPRIRDHSRRTKGLEIRVIDPFESEDPSRWPDDNTRQQLIKECRESSDGPFLLALIGHRYGPGSLPTRVEVTEYQLLLQACQEAGVSTRELEGAYRRDENCIPASYCLRPDTGPPRGPPESLVSLTHLRSLILILESLVEANEEKVTKSKVEELRTMFQSSVAQCVHAGLMSPQRGRSFHRSVLDADLHFALDECPDENMMGRCLVYVNRVVNPEGDRAKQQLSQTPSPPCCDSFLSELCDSFLPRAVTARHLLVYTTTTECDPRHGYTTSRRRGYATSLCQQVHCDLVGLIGSLEVPERRDDALMEEQQELCDVLSSLYEVVQPEEEQEIRAYVAQGDPLGPLVVTGGPCTGKTVLLAHCARQMKLWLSHSDPVVISSFYNFSSDTSVELLVSCLCRRISSMYQESSLTPSEPDIDASISSGPKDPSCVTNTSELTSRCCPTSVLDSHHESSLPGYISGSDLNLKTRSNPKTGKGRGGGLLTDLLKPDLSLCELREHLSSLLTLLPSTKRPLVILLDGLDHLDRGSGLQLIHSLLSPLPPNVKLILTASSNPTRLLQDIQLHYPQCTHLGHQDPGFRRVQLGLMDRKSCLEMLASLLRRTGRKVTSGQQALVNQALTSCRLPLFVRLLGVHAALWRSDSDVSESSLPDGVHSSISSFLDLLQLPHGSALVVRAVSFLSLSCAGLTEAELVDLLSRNNDVRAGHGEGSRSDKEVSQVDVERLLLDLKRFLVTRTNAGSRVLQWASRHFKLVVAKRFLGSEEVRRSIHEELAEYFSWRGSDRNVASKIQIKKHPSLGPLVSADVGPVSLRRLVELPYHLKRCSRWEDLESGLLMSFIFHLEMVQAGRLLRLVAMLESEEGSTQFLRERLLLTSVLKASACVLQVSPLTLPSVMESDLHPYLEVFPALRGYTRDIKQERRKTENGLGLILCPSPCSVPAIRRLKLDDLSVDVWVTETACTEQGVVAEVLNDGAARFWKGSGCHMSKLSLSREEVELKFTGVKSSGGLLVLTTRCHRVFVCDATGSETLLEVQDPLRTKSQSNTIQEVLVRGKKLILRWRIESFVSVFDISNETLTHFQCRSVVSCLAASFDTLYCGQDEGSVSIFNIQTGTLLGTCSNRSAVSFIILCQDKSACVDRTGNVTLWDMTTRTKQPRLVKETTNQSKSTEILHTDYSDDMNALLLCEAGRLALFDTCDWELWDEFVAPQKKTFTQAALSLDGHHLLALLESCTLVLVWRISSGECVLSLETHKQPHSLLKTATDVICFARDGSITLWDSETIAAAATTPKMRRGVKEVSVEPSGRRFYTCDGSETVWRWSLDVGLPEAHLLHDGPVEKLQLSPNSVHLVSLSGGEIYVWRTESGENVVRIRGSRVSEVLITPNSKFGVSVSEGGLSRVWRVSSGSVVCRINLYLSDAQVSPEGTFLIGRHHGYLLAASLWSGSISSSCLQGLDHVVAFHTLSHHPDFALVLGASGAVYTWKVAEGTVCRHFQLPHAFHCQPRHFQMSSDGNLALLSTDDRTIRLLDLAQVRLCSFNAEGPVIKACLDRNGSFLAYISDPNSDSCTCSPHMRSVLTVTRLSDGGTIGRVILPRTPLSLVVSVQRVFVGFSDGSVGVYSVSNNMVGEDEVERSREGPCGLTGSCPFDRDVSRWLPQVAATVTWP